MTHAALEFTMFRSPHTGDTAAAFDTAAASPFFVMTEWDLGKDIRTITTDHAADIWRGVNFICFYSKSTFPATQNGLLSLYLHFIAHVLNLCVRGCMAPVHRQISKNGAILNSLCCSVKRRDLFQYVYIEPEQLFAPRSFNYETHFWATFNMMKRCYSISRVNDDTKGITG